MIKNNQTICFKKNNDPFIKWLIGMLGPVIFGAKPAEILSFPNSDPHTPDKLNKIKDNFNLCKKISYCTFSYNENSTKVLFYNMNVLDTVLQDQRNSKFLYTIDYPKEYTLEGYLHHLISKMIDGSIPEEIGIFLGYPLKDVLGFIGHPSLQLTKVNGWRVYGDEKPSDKIYNEFLAAKKRMKNLLTKDPVKEILAYA